MINSASPKFSTDFAKAPNREMCFQGPSGFHHRELRCFALASAEGVPGGGPERLLLQVSQSLVLIPF